MLTRFRVWYCRTFCKPFAIQKRRIGDYVYWQDQYGRIIREEAPSE